jgi:hypothetical protein
MELFVLLPKEDVEVVSVFIRWRRLTMWVGRWAHSPIDQPLYFAIEDVVDAAPAFIRRTSLAV